MTLNIQDLGDLPSPFYRVAVKAIIFDEQQRMLVLKNDSGDYEIPGGGWEFDESFAECLTREIQEELQVGVASVGPVALTYRGVDKRRGFRILRIAAVVKLEDRELVPSDGMVAAEYVTREQFLALDLMKNEGDIHQYVDTIWKVQHD